MTLVGCEFSPVVAVQQVVGGGQSHLASQSFVQRRLDMAIWVRSQLVHRVQGLVMFDLGLDSKLWACQVVRMIDSELD